MYSLNTQSGMLHLGDHGGDANSEPFERADAADKAMFEAGKKMTFCKTCFPDRTSATDTTTLEAESVDTDRKTAGSPTENTTARGTLPPRVVDPTADGEA